MKQKNSEEQIKRNLSYLRALQRSEHNLVNKLVNKETTISQEVRDLFPFFSSWPAYLHCIFKEPRLCPDHNKRIGELEQVINGVQIGKIGYLGVKELYSDALSEYIHKMRKIKSTTIATGIGTVASISSMAYGFANENALFFVIGAGLSLPALRGLAGLLFLDYINAPPKSYWQLKEKGEKVQYLIDTNFNQ